MSVANGGNSWEEEEAEWRQNDDEQLMGDRDIERQEMLFLLNGKMHGEEPWGGTS